MIKDTSVAVTSRIRLARNLSGYYFPNLLRGTNKEIEIAQNVQAVLQRIGGFTFYKMRELSPTFKASLVERYFVSTSLAENDGGVVCINRDGQTSVMINEEDHIREQCLFKGLDLGSAYSRISSLDAILNRNLRFAKNGDTYFTACPTNVGTGLRASVMMFLPALTYSYAIGEIQERAEKIGLTIRGAFGEGSQAECFLYQISNEITLNVSPKSLITQVENFSRQIIKEEIDERYALYTDYRAQIDDKCLRAFGILQNAVILGYNEFVDLISKVKLGIAMGIIKSNEPDSIDSLMVTARNNSLSLVKDIEASSIDEKRAAYVRRALKKFGLRANFNE